VLAPALPSQVRPRGIYAVVNVEDEIATLQTANPSITAAQLDAGFNSFYQDLLSNPAVAGLAVRPHWATLNPNPPGAANTYCWNLVDDAFNQAALWNSQNPAKAPKTIQLIVQPGFQSPQWILNQISELRRAVSDAGRNASQHVRNGDLHRLFGGWQWRRTAAAVESGLQERMANVFDGAGRAVRVESAVCVDRGGGADGGVSQDEFAQRRELE